MEMNFGIFSCVAKALKAKLTSTSSHPILSLINDKPKFDTPLANITYDMVAYFAPRRSGNWHCLKMKKVNLSKKDQITTPKID